MDFSPDKGPKLKLKSRLKIKKPFAVISAALFLIVVSVILISVLNQSPLPADIKNQISYKAVYPSSSTGKLMSDYQYKSDENTLNFTVSNSNTNIVFAEQPAPESLGSGNQIYYQALGVHPYAQFNSKLGPVALVNFYQTGSLKPVGQTAILVADGTMVVAHSANNLTNEKWKQIINSLKISK